MRSGIMELLNFRLISGRNENEMDPQDRTSDPRRVVMCVVVEGVVVWRVCVSVPLCGRHG